MNVAKMQKEQIISNNVEHPMWNLATHSADFTLGLFWRGMNV